MFTESRTEGTGRCCGHRIASRVRGTGARSSRSFVAPLERLAFDLIFEASFFSPPAAHFLSSRRMCRLAVSLAASHLPKNPGDF